MVRPGPRRVAPVVDARQTSRHGVGVHVAGLLPRTRWTGGSWGRGREGGVWGRDGRSRDDGTNPRKPTVKRSRRGELRTGVDDEIGRKNDRVKGVPEGPQNGTGPRQRTSTWRGRTFGHETPNQTSPLHPKRDPGEVER